MDELDEFWTIHFNRSASLIERRMIAAFDRTVGAEDPTFPILMMQVCNLYETLGSVEKAVLQHGPALESQMGNLRVGIEEVSRELGQLTHKLSALSLVSTKLLGTQQALLDQRWRDLRGTLPDWGRTLVAALITAVIVLVGGAVVALFRQ